MESSSIFFIGSIGLFFGSLCFYLCIKNLQNAIYILIIEILFGGIISVNLGSGAISILFRDLFIILPIYINIFISRRNIFLIEKIPSDVFLSLMFLISVTLISEFNSENTSMIGAIIGTKVWLYYIPLVVLGIILGVDRELRIKTFRMILLTGLIVCVIGLFQSLMVRVVGYQTVIGWFYGSHGRQVTQNFQMFSDAGGIYRIPGTFSFSAQYSGFLTMFITIAVIVMNSDKNRVIKLTAQISVMLGAICSLLSGSRSQIIIVPVIFAAYALSGLLGRVALLILPLGIAVGVMVLQFAGTDIFELFAVGEGLAANYGSNFVIDQIETGLEAGFLGNGIGTATNAARYFVTNFEDNGYFGLESYFGKSAFEMGYLGFMAISVMFIIIVVRSLFILLKNIPNEKKFIMAPLAIYLIHCFVFSFKGTVLDTDPGNIAFWLFLGVMIGRNSPLTSSIRFANDLERPPAMRQGKGRAVLLVEEN